MSDDMLAEYESHEQFVEPFSEYGAVIMQSGIPVRIKDSGGQGTFVRVPQPTAGQEGDILTVQPDLSADWSLPFERTITVTIPNATLKSTTPLTLIPAAGANTIIIVFSVTFIFNYGGNNAFTNAPITPVRYNALAGSGASYNFGASFWNATSSRCATRQNPMSSDNTALSSFVNQPITFECSSAFTGNAANDNTATCILTYTVINI